jgi:plasmid stability protein
MSQVTLRDLPAPVEAYLRERARLEGRSLSKVASDILAESLGLEEKRRNLGRFAGLWNEAEAAAFDRTTELFEVVDKDVWA